MEPGNPFGACGTGWTKDTGLQGPITTYAYDVLGNLTQVIQNGSRQRTFTYNSLSQLLTAQNPESGTITYAYDGEGNLASKTDARGVITCYGNLGGSTCTPNYDALHRPGSKTFSDGTPPSVFGYDNNLGWLSNTIGRLTYSQVNGKTVTWFNYDLMGRVANQYTAPPSLFGSGSSFSLDATYNLDGSLATLKYPSGRKVAFGYDAAARLTSASMTEFNGPVTSYPYYTATAYAPSGPVTYWSLGNGNVEAMNLNNRLQISSWGMNQGATERINKNYSYGSLNNGNIFGIADVLDPSRNQTFTYDQMNRIATAEEGTVGDPRAAAGGRRILLIRGGI